MKRERRNDSRRKSIKLLPLLVKRRLEAGTASKKTTDVKIPGSILRA
jgi:hypothetical protein